MKPEPRNAFLGEGEPTRLANGVCRALLPEFNSRPRALDARSVDTLLDDGTAVFELLTKFPSILRNH
jgi:hypothetical protein